MPAGRMGGSPDPSLPAGHAREPEDDQRHRENAQDDVAPPKARGWRHRLGGPAAKFIHAGPPQSFPALAGGAPGPIPRVERKKSPHVITLMRSPFHPLR